MAQSFLLPLSTLFVMMSFLQGLLVSVLIVPSHGLATKTRKSPPALPTLSLENVKLSQKTILDGGEWASVQAILLKEGKIIQPSKIAAMTIVTGMNEEQERIVAMQSPKSKEESGECSVYEDSIAKIPAKMSDKDAVSTYITSLAAIHCVLPRIEEPVGGAEDSTFIQEGKKVVVLGGNDLACFAAQGLASLGMSVSLVSTGSPKVRGEVDVMKPAAGPEQEGFSEVIGQFDSLLDTTNDERGTMTNSRPAMDTRLISLLKERHGCERYVSTLTAAQSIIGKEGVLWGPGKAKDYISKVGRSVETSKSSNRLTFSAGCQSILPPTSIGRTVQTLLTEGVVFTDSQRNQEAKDTKAKSGNENLSVRGFSLKNFWEQSTWPRDSEDGSTRFGLPVLEVDEDEDEDDDDDDEDYFERFSRRRSSTFSYSEEGSEEYDRELELIRRRVEGAPENPYVVDIVGVKGMKEDIVEQELDCILFLSAKFCRTCKSLNPQFTRLARAEASSSDIVFAKAEASGLIGKHFSRALEVKAVPAFIFFREGKIFGKLSLSRLPSKKFSRAIEMLESGEMWDTTQLRDDDDDKRIKRK